MVVPYGVSAGNYRRPGQAGVRPTRAAIWAYLAMFIDKALALRLAAGAAPALRPVDPATGWLSERHAVEDLYRAVRWPLPEAGAAYKVASGRRREPLGNGYAAIPPLREAVRAGVPVEPLVLKRAPSSEIFHQARKEGMRTLREDGWQKVVQGLTTPEEILLSTVH